MTTDNRFQPDRPPIFLSGHAEETAPPDVEKGWDVATISSRIFKASALAAAVTTIGVGALSIGNPVLLVTSVTDWWNDKPALQLEADTSASTIQTMAEVPAATDAAAREEIAAAAAPADPKQAEAIQRPAEPVQVQAESSQRPVAVAQSQTENGPPVTEELFKQFQAWAAAEEARAASARAARARVAQDTPQARPAKKQRRVQSVQNARAEVRPQRQRRTRVREEQDAGGQPPPAADPRAPDPAAQNAQQPSFFQSLGLR